MLSNHYKKSHTCDVISSKEKVRKPYQHTSYSTVQSHVAYYVSPPPKRILEIPWEYLKDEWYRLMTFVMYPTDSYVSSIILASKGFVYPGTGSNYTVMCYFCTVVLDDIRTVDDVDKEHKRLRINCPMVTAGACKYHNICMETRYPENAKTILSNFIASRNNSIQSAFLVGEPILSSPETVQTNENTARSSQPSDSSALSAVVTNTTDLDAGDQPNRNCRQNIQSPQSEQSSSMRDQQDNSSTSQTSRSNASVTNTNSSHNETHNNSHTHHNNTHQDNVTSNGSEENSSQPISYDQLGIITAKPKRPEYTILASRRASFQEWPKNHHLKPDDLAEAGFFYTGSGDCARCFHCGGSLRHWEPEDDVWVEHARWFPHCVFLPQAVGKEFINIVQEMKIDMEAIKYDEVLQRMSSSGIPTPLKFMERLVANDAAVQAVIDNGFDQNEVIKLALQIRKSGEPLSSDKLFKAAKANNLSFVHNEKKLASDSISIRKGGNKELDEETIETLLKENGELRQISICKICMDTEVSVAFLPCGHFVSCTECSFALRSCPLCREEIKGLIKGYIGYG